MLLTPKKSISLLMIVTFTLMIAINVLANALPLNGLNTGEVSNMYPNLFAPAPVTFAIWGVIYALSLLLVVYQSYAVWSDKKTIALNEKQMFLFSISCMLNGIWLFAWHYLLISLSVVIMLWLLLVLIYLYQQINRIKFDDTLGSLAIRSAISIYLGWISVATIANITAWLTSFQWQGFGISPVFYTIVVIGIGSILGMLMIILKRDYLYALVIIWAYIGIILKRTAQAPEQTVIILTATISIALLIVAMIINFFRPVSK